jgi:hypothetical protein
VPKPYKIKVGPKAFTPGYNPTADIFSSLGDVAGGISSLIT